MSTTILTLGMHTVGRSEDATIVIEHPSCSRKHATLIVSPTHQVSLVDEGSSQGTFIDTVEVEPRKQTLLCDGARVQFGVSERSFLLQLPAVARYQAPARSGLSSDEKKKLLWGGKRASANTRAWATASAGSLGGERGAKFMALTGASKAAKRQRNDEANGGSGSGSGSGWQGEQDEAARAARQQAQLFATLERQFDQARGGGAGPRRPM